MTKDFEGASVASVGHISTERHALKLRGIGLFVLSFQTLGKSSYLFGASPSPPEGRLTTF